MFPEWIVKSIDAAGKGPLAFGAFCIAALALLADKFFRTEKKVWVRVFSWCVIAMCIMFLAVILAAPEKKNPVEITSQVSKVQQDTKSMSDSPVVKTCRGEQIIPFKPMDPGVTQKNPDGSYIDLGDGGSGTRMHEFKFEWRAPAAVTSAVCNLASFQHPLGGGTSSYFHDNIAGCIGMFNDGTQGSSLDVKWDGQCR